MTLPDHLAQPSLRCIHFVAATTEVPERELQAAEIACAVATVWTGTGERDILSAIGSAFQFPAYYGNNWDALEECLRDLATWLPRRGFVIWLNNSQTLLRTQYRTAATLVEVTLSAADWWAAQHVAFHMVFAD